jgi:hypothetical protein
MSQAFPWATQVVGKWAPRTRQIAAFAEPQMGNRKGRVLRFLKMGNQNYPAQR